MQRGNTHLHQNGEDLGTAYRWQPGFRSSRVLNTPFHPPLHTAMVGPPNNGLFGCFILNLYGGCLLGVMVLGPLSLNKNNNKKNNILLNQEALRLFLAKNIPLSTYIGSTAKVGSLANLKLQ